MIPQKLSVNEVYNFPVQEGARANFLSTSGNVLQIGLPGITPAEQLAFRKKPIKIGLIIDQPLLLWLFDFGEGGQLDSPFDARLYKKDQLNLLDITNQEQRLAIEMHVIDLDTQILKAIRLFTLSPELTLKFMSAVQDQLSQAASSLYNQKLQNIYQLPLDQLIKKTKMYKSGE